MDSLYAFLSSSDSDEEENIALHRRKLRDNSNVLDIPNVMFRKLFRLTKEAFVDILSIIQGEFKQSFRATHIPPTLKFAITLRFLAQGSYQDSVGQEYFAPVCQATVSRILEEVTTILETTICPSKISFELTESEKLSAKRHFYEISGIPGVIGAIDGTHLKIIRPKDSEHLYFGRKGYHTLNAMVICDHMMKIRAVNASHGGASHDSSIWTASDEKCYLQNKYRNGDKCCILGDSGYPLEPWLLTPYRVAEENSPESLFNIRHAKARCIIERTFGILKGRFRCTLCARELHYSPEKSSKIFNVCAALHNICIDYKIHLETDLLLNSAERDNDEFIGNFDNYGEIRNREANNIRNIIRDNLPGSLSL